MSIADGSKNGAFSPSMAISPLNICHNNYFKVMMYSHLGLIDYTTKAPLACQREGLFDIY